MRLAKDRIFTGAYFVGAGVAAVMSGLLVYHAVRLAATELEHPPSVQAQSGVVAVVTPADITGDNAAHPLAAGGQARTILIVCPSTNSAAVRIGNDAVSSSIGTPCAPGGTLFFPSLTPSERYSLSGIYYLAGTGDKLSVQWVR